MVSDSVECILIESMLISTPWEEVQHCLREAEPPKLTLTHTERQALKDLKDLSKHEGLTIPPADKGKQW